MRLLQNKALQKQWLVSNGFETAPFLAFDQELLGHEAESAFGDRYVIKSQRGGYDGRGVEVVRDGNVLSGLGERACIAEQFVSHSREIAVLVARGWFGEATAYPVFEASFDGGGNVLRQVVCPAALSQSLGRDALGLGKAIVERLGGVGVFAIEMFLTDNGLLVNEISPRVHNVGHLTMEAFSASQFEQHVRAITGMALAPIRQRHPAAAMTNVLYEPALSKACRTVDRLTTDAQHDVRVHWYGKQAPRPLRKMGHITAVSSSISGAKRKADYLLQLLKAS